MKKTTEERNEKRTEKMKKTASIRRALSSLALMLLFLMLAGSVSAALEITLVSQTEPLEFRTMQTIKLNITSNATLTLATIEFDGTNHTLQKEQAYYIYAWIPPVRGLLSYKAYAINAENSTAAYEGSFMIQDTRSPQVLQLAPSGTINYTLVELKAVTDENSSCKYDTYDVSYDSMYFALSDEGTIHTKLRLLGDGLQTFYIKCKDPANNIGESSILSFTIDSSPPSISDISPTGTVTIPAQTLKLFTNENANCRWSAVSQQYEAMPNTFQLTGDTRHEHPITLSEGINTYYFGCRDKTGNTNERTVLHVELNLPPKASITISRNDSDNYRKIRKGTYELSLASSEPLSQTPTLRFNYCGKSIPVPLQGSSQDWEGYLMIEEGDLNCVGEFSFQGIDMKGTVGTEITSGKLALLDTANPPTTSAPKLEISDDKIRVSWIYDGEEVDHFNIYRSTTGYPLKTDLKASSPGMQYYDSDVIDKIGYYYKVCAVDKAGNEGELSEEEFIMADLNNMTIFKQNPDILNLVNQKITVLQGKLNNLNSKITELNQESGEKIVNLIKEKELVKTQEDIKGKIELLIGELKSYRETRISREELERKISIIDNKLLEAEKGIINEVTIKNDVEAEQLLDYLLIEQAAAEYLKNKQGADAQKKRYVDEAKILQEQTRITQKITSYEISFENKGSETVTLVTESIFAAQELGETLIQEVLPKGEILVADLELKVSPAELNSLGPIWKIKSLPANTLSYEVTKEKDMSILKTIRTILLKDWDSFLSSASEQDSSDKITGNVTADEGKGSLLNSILIILAVMMAVALLAYYVFFTKSENKSEEELQGRLRSEEVIAVRNMHIPDSSSQSTIAGAATDTALNEPGQLYGLIALARENLAKGELETAAEAYSQAIECYYRSKLGLKDKLELNLKLNSLYEELSTAQSIISSSG